MRAFVLLFAWMVGMLTAVGTPTWAQSPVGSFTGTWKQDNAQSQPPRKGEVTLKIDDQDPSFLVETTAQGASGTTHHAVQRYTTGGKESVTTGADGDEFHTTVTRHGGTLALTIVEHEDGRVIPSTETWTLIENGAAFKRVRQGGKDGGEQTIVYERIPSPR